MTAITSSYQRPARFPWLLVFVIAAAVAVGLTITHADTKHGSEATTVRQCLDNGNKIQIWWNASNQHRIELCKVSDSLYGLRVLKNVNGQWEEITAFLKTKMSNLGQVEQYLSNSGAVKIWVK